MWGGTWWCNIRRICIPIHGRLYLVLIVHWGGAFFIMLWIKNPWGLKHIIVLDLSVLTSTLLIFNGLNKRMEFYYTFAGTLKLKYRDPLKFQTNVNWQCTIFFICYKIVYSGVHWSSVQVSSFLKANIALHDFLFLPSKVTEPTKTYAFSRVAGSSIGQMVLLYWAELQCWLVA